MIKRHIPLLVGGLALVVFGSLALAQNPTSQEETGVHINTPSEHIERQELFKPLVDRVVSRAVGIEPVRLQIAETITVEARISPIELFLPEAQLTEHHLAIQPIRHEFKAITGQVIDKAYPISLSVSAYDSVSAVTRPAADCVVTSTVDSGPGTLRQCLENAVAGDTITFDAGVFPPTSPVTISLSSPLPWIIIDNLTIDASEADVILNGSGLSDGFGFVISGADGVKIQGLQIVNFPLVGVAIGSGATNTMIGGDRFTGRGPLGQGNLISGNGIAGVWFEGSGMMNNTVLGNYVGTDVSGTAPLANAKCGVLIGFGATNNTVGGDTPGTHNLISGNGQAGVWVQNIGTSENRVMGNYIGTDVSGTASLGNEEYGVFIGGGTTNNIIGGDTLGARNLISGNGKAGVWMQNMGTSRNQVLGNYIGTDVSGTAALANLGAGVFIGFEASDNIVGGDTPGAGNLISGNKGCGVQIQGPVVGNQVLGNYIGTNISGTAALGNALMGVAIIDGATDNTIGGDTPGASNLISGNEYVGVWIREAGTSGNRVIGNYIGTDVSGTASLGNTLPGVVVFGGAKNNIIGGNTLGARNLISGNDSDGVLIQDAETSGNQVLGNYIGTDISGVAPLGNRNGVIILGGATGNIIGGDTPGARNLISGNRDFGIRIEASETSETSGNWVLGNYIGTNISGTHPLSNSGGVFIGFGATNNNIGGDTFGARNFISGNGIAGVIIQSNETMGNVVQGNYIGTDVSGTASLGNAVVGVVIHTEATNNIIGGDTPGARNIISGNGDAGVWIEGVGTSKNRVLGNYIGTDVSGTVSLGNAKKGVLIHAGATNNTIGGDAPEAHNLISGNGQIGVKIEDSGTMSNVVQGNYIGTDVSGIASLGNAMVGVVIHAGATNNTIGGDTLGARNLISGNGIAGVWIEDVGTSKNRVLGNYIGTDVSGTAGLGNLLYGIGIGHGASNNVIGGVTITVGNTIAFNDGDGVYVDGSQTLYNTISHNSIHANDGLGIELTSGGNKELSPPTITMAISTSISGQTQPHYVVEVFSDNNGEGQWFEGSVKADKNGNFTLTQADDFHGPKLTSTVTDADGNTSEFFAPPVPIAPQKRIFLPIIIKNSG